MLSDISTPTVLAVTRIGSPSMKLTNEEKTLGERQSALEILAQQIAIRQGSPDDTSQVVTVTFPAGQCSSQITQKGCACRIFTNRNVQLTSGLY
jgi:hypothetical protein